MMLYELAEAMGCTTYVLREFAPDDTEGIKDRDEIRDDVVAAILEAHLCAMVNSPVTQPDAYRSDPYNGHCRECYAFKGQYGGQCVEPECDCGCKIKINAIYGKDS